jgi:hypothetical protein
MAVAACSGDRIDNERPKSPILDHKARTCNCVTTSGRGRPRRTRLPLRKKMFAKR